MTSHPIKYDRSRYPIQQAHKKCRGCNGDVPKGRSTWCSDECFNKYEPKRVRHACWLRDKGVCCECGADTEKEKSKVPTFPNGVDHWHPRFWNGIEFLRDKFEAACKIYIRRRVQLYRAIENRRIKMNSSGWPKHTSRDWWEMDHIVPFSEGGITVLENVRTLCCVCHKKRTKKWHGERKKPAPTPSC